MALSKTVTSHHTAWISCGAEGCQPRPVRYSVDGDKLVCFGDGVLAPVADNTRVRVAVHEIAGGPMLTEFPATLRTAAPDDVDPSAFAGLLDHVSLGRTAEEVERSLEHHRSTRRVVVLEP